MRFPRTSPDCVPVRNGDGRSTCKEDGKIMATNTNGSSSSCSGSGLESKGGLRFRSPCRNQDNTNMNICHQHDSPQRQRSPSPSPSPSLSLSPSSTSRNGNGDVLLQWGHRKRSRVSRADIRAATEESSTSLQPNKQSRINHTPTHTAPALLVPKLPSVSMPPPPPLPSANARARKDARSPSRRNLEDPLGSGSGIGRESGCRNSHGNNRVVCRSAARKRSPSGLETSDRRVPPSGSAKFPKPSGSSTTQASDRLNNQPDSASLHSEQAAAGGDKVTVEVIEWPRIYIALSRKEKEDDFQAMKGTKLPQRPKKRAKNIDRTLQYCFPGMWLSDLTKSRYEVREKKCVKKQKRRGLKGMESLDSDSE